jgi:hypothetical protein
MRVPVMHRGMQHWIEMEIRRLGRIDASALGRDGVLRYADAEGTFVKNTPDLCMPCPGGKQAIVMVRSLSTTP